jgi:diguanylate cyclase (GGDEF)-like protein
MVEPIFIMLHRVKVVRVQSGRAWDIGPRQMNMIDVYCDERDHAPEAELALSHDQLTLLYADLREKNAQLVARVRVLEDEICRDTLTPLFNRRHFEQAVATCIAHCQRYDSRAALLFVDVDDLKAINDTYGHAAGDEALRTIADVLVGNVRTTDVVARIGGDEFGLLLGTISHDDISQKIAQLTSGIAACRPQFAKGRQCLSATFGHAFISPDDRADKVLARADQIMYQFKRSRRAALG